MGYLDTKGLKKVLTKIKDWATTSIDSLNANLNDVRGSLLGLRDNVYNTITEITRRQTFWDVSTMHHIMEQGEAYYPANSFYKNVYEYENHNLNTKLYIKFLSAIGEYNYLPDPTQEYILSGYGKVFKNCIEWPHTTQLPWPNSVIPEFKDDSTYTIHIVGGVVLSCIENPLCKVSVTIEANIAEEYVDGASHPVAHLLIPSDAVYLDGELVDNPYIGNELCLSFTKPGPTNILIEFNRDIDDFYFGAENMHTTYVLHNLITKIDLSHLNPECSIKLEGIQDVPGVGDVPATSIVFPEFPLDESCWLKLEDVVLEDFNLSYLSRTTAKYISLACTEVRSLSNKFEVPLFDGNTQGYSVLFNDSYTKNSILRRMARAFLEKDWIFSHDSFYSAHNIEHIGDIHYPWRFADIGTNVAFHKCTNLKFAAFTHSSRYQNAFSRFFDCTNTSLREVIFVSDEPVYSVEGPCKTDGHQPEEWPSIDIFVLNMPGYSLQENAYLNFNPNHPTKVYIPTGWSDEDKYNLQNRLESAWTLHQYDSIDEIPFQYAPTDGEVTE